MLEVPELYDSEDRGGGPQRVGPGICSSRVGGWESGYAELRKEAWGALPGVETLKGRTLRLEGLNSCQEFCIERHSHCAAMRGIWMYRVIECAAFRFSIRNLYPVQSCGFGFQGFEAPSRTTKSLSVSVGLEVRLARWMGIGDATGGEREGNRKLGAYENVETKVGLRHRRWNSSATVSTPTVEIRGWPKGELTR